MRIFFAKRVPFLLLVTGGLMLSCENLWAGPSGLVSLADLRTEGVVQPMGVEETAPRFSWRYEAGADAQRGFRQSAYRVQVASSAEKLAKGDADLWDSGRQAGNDSLSILYAGKPLASARRYYWQVTGFDTAGKAYPAKPQFFETGLLKAEDWGGAQWIGARNERPKTLPANLQGLTDYSFETRFRILEGSATFQFRAAYAWAKGYGIEIQPGTSGKFIVTCQKGDKKEVLKEFPLSNCATGTWHHLKVVLKGADFSFRIDDTPINPEPLHDETSPAGTMALGALGPDGKKGLVQFDDFTLTANGETLVQETFDNPALFAFQDCFFSNNAYSKVKEEALEVRALNVFVEPKEGLAAPLFRKAFSIAPKKITRARAYVAGLGYYTFWFNGKRLDDYLLHPGMARYNKTAYYTVYDLTERLEKNNSLAFELGRGWYAMTTPTMWGETFYRDWMAEPALRTLVTIDYADGTRQTVVSDPSFKTAPGPILLDSVKAGEIHDARKEIPGWNLAAFHDQAWSAAVIAKGNMPSAAPGLTAQLFEPIRAVETLSPKSIDKIEDEQDAWLVDFGTNMAGTVAMQLKTEPGQRLRVAYVERERAIFGAERWNNFNPQGTGSYQTDIFIAKGGAKETFQSRYSYKGFRYARIEGLKEKPLPSQIAAKAINSDMVKVGQFTSSSELWNKVWEAGRRTIQSNMHSIPNDCAFEKLPWTADDSIAYYATTYNYDLRNLFDKRLQDYADDISPAGRIRDVMPSTWGEGGQDPAWGGSYVNIAWRHYQTYGDRSVLERHYNTLKLYMSSLIKEGEASEKPPLLTKPRVGYGDWVPPDLTNVPPEGALVYYNLYFYRYLRMMRDIAEVLGQGEDQASFDQLSLRFKKAFNEHCYDEKEGAYFSTNRQFGYRQSPQAIALAFGIVPQERIAVVAGNLVKDIERRKGHLWTGILGTEFIADALCEAGHADTAYQIHLKDTFPSIGNIIREGGTTISEFLSIGSSRALNIRIFTTPLAWMARYVAGLRVDGVLGSVPGFREALIAPYPCPEQVTFARMEYDSPMGRYHSGWRVIPEGLVYDIIIPPNASAQVQLPLLGGATLSESGAVIYRNGKAVEAVSGVLSNGIEKDRFTLTVGSGTYHFMVTK
jgi:alpha-L-rhamnosidase